MFPYLILHVRGSVNEDRLVALTTDDSAGLNVFKAAKSDDIFLAASLTRREEKRIGVHPKCLSSYFKSC